MLGLSGERAAGDQEISVSNEGHAERGKRGKGKGRGEKKKETKERKGGRRPESDRRGGNKLARMAGTEF